MGGILRTLSWDFENTHPVVVDDGINGPSPW